MSALTADVALAWRFALRELRGGRRKGLRGVRLFLACLALGVGVIATIGSLRAAIETGLEQEGAALLGGDAELSFTYRFASDEERAWMQDVAVAVSEIAEFRSMAVVGLEGEEERALTQVKAVDGAYPLRGAFRLSPPMSLEEALAKQSQDSEAPIYGGVMEKVLADRLGLGLGDGFHLGQQQFRLTALIDAEPDAAASGFALGPRTLVRRDSLEASGLLAPGTLFSSKYRLALAPDTNLSALQGDAEARFEQNGARWRDARNGAPGIARFVDRLGAFLVLVGLSGLAVGGIGVSTAVRAYLAQKTETIAILRTLGAEARVIFLCYVIQVALLAGLGIALGLGLGSLGVWALGPVLAEQLPFPAVFSIYPSALLEAALYGALTAALFTLWPLASAQGVRAATLFRSQQTGEGLRLPSLPFLIATALLLGLLTGTAAVFSGSFALTLWTAGGLLGALLVLAVTAFGLRHLARWSTRAARGWPVLRWALAAIASPREGTTATLLALGLGLSVIAAIGQIDGNMRRAISGNLPDVAPSYFFVDIQRDQMPAFLERSTSDPGVSRVDSAPMLRGVITQINGRPAREVAGDHWVIRGDRGITYAGALPANTEITEGTWWGEGYSGAPQISFAAEEAEEIGLKLGDSMTVNILGRDITGTLTSFREVDFSTAGMGFILAMNETALAGAPHSYIASVYAEEAAEAPLLRDLARVMPNITAIRVRDAITRVSEILGQMGRATAYGAAATLLTGFLVLMGTAAAAEPARRYEAAVLKTLGAERRQILLSLALRAILMGLCAGAVALVAGITGAWAVNHFVFESSYVVIWGNVLLVISGGILVTLAATLGFAWQPLAARPARVLRNAD